MRVKYHIIGALSLIALGSLPFAYTRYRYFSHNWTPLTARVKLSPGKEETREFTTDLTGTYRVWLAFDTAPDITRQDCLIGNDFLIKQECANAPRTLFLTWSLRRGNKVVVDQQPYKPGLMSGSGENETGLGVFEGKRGAVQSITLDVTADPAELKAFHPRVVVEAASSYWEDWIIFGQMALIPAALSTLIGLTWIGVSLFKAKRSKAN